MGWFRYSSSVRFRRRKLITIDGSAGGAVTSLDAEVTIPKHWHQFWSVIDSACDYIRVTAADGVTAVSYDVDDGAGGAFSSTNRTGRIRIDGYTVPLSTAGMYAAWVYYDPTGAVTDGSSVVTMSSTVSGYIELARPSGRRQYVYQPQIPGATRPRDPAHKTAAEQVDFWIRVDLAFSRLGRDSETSRKAEEPYYTTASVLDTAGADTSSMYSLSSNRLVELDNGQVWLKHQVKAGTHGSNYTVAPTVHTVMPFAPNTITETVQPRIGLAVRSTRMES